ncbi:MAG: hypothetical protein ACR2NA_09465 [Solirubrobacterales bacterium]
MLRDRYGAGPLHLLAALTAFAIAGYGFVAYFDELPLYGFAVWFTGAILIHDAVLYPLYSSLGTLATRAAGESADEVSPSRAQALNHVRVPLVLSFFMLVVYFPLIVGFGRERYEAASNLSGSVYLGRWLALSAALFVASALIYIASAAWRARRG